MPLKGATPEKDFLQRDFAINAMAVAVSSGSLFDPQGGQVLIRHQTLKRVAELISR